MRFFRFTERPTNNQDVVLHDLLGQGKYNVYKGFIPSKTEECAIKVFPNTHSSQIAFQKEKRVMSTIKHQNIINCIPDTKTIDQEKNNLLVMEYAPYGDFFDLIMSRELVDETLIRSYFCQLIEGIEHLHNSGNAHLDLKLDNLLLGRNYQLKITDFDLAHNIRDKTKPISRGSTDYRAPEVIDDSFEDIFAADIYSIGVILFICFTGEFPFVEKYTPKGRELRDYDLYHNHNETFWRNKSACYQMNFSDCLKELLNGMLAKDPSKRFTIQNIKDSEWYKGQVVEGQKLEKEMKCIYERVKVYSY